MTSTALHHPSGDASAQATNASSYYITGIRVKIDTPQVRNEFKWNSWIELQCNFSDVRGIVQEPEGLLNLIGREYSQRTDWLQLLVFEKGEKCIAKSEKMSVSSN
jgi:hypothetical protein